MLTGDDRSVAVDVANHAGIHVVFANLLPEDKVAKVEELAAGLPKRGRNRLAFVGDGINDAPVIIRADVGVAMGALGSDAAVEAADVVIMDDKPSKLGTAVRIALHTRRIVLENIALALTVKGAFIITGILGMATMWEAVFADVGVALLAILNSTRVLRKRYDTVEVYPHRAGSVNAPAPR
jgi:Cd2+/Zn2+-exporting ATPase